MCKCLIYISKISKKNRKYRIFSKISRYFPTLLDVNEQFAKFGPSLLSKVKHHCLRRGWVWSSLCLAWWRWRRLIVTKHLLHVGHACGLSAECALWWMMREPRCENCFSQMLHEYGRGFSPVRCWSAFNALSVSDFTAMPFVPVRKVTMQPK